MKQDEVIYAYGGVRVTTAKVEIKGTTYPVNGITSVGTRVVKGAASHGPLLAICGICGLLFGGSLLVMSNTAPGLFWFGGMAIAAGVFLLVLASQSAPGRDRTAVILGTAGGDRQALVTDEDAALSLKSAIETAIERRG